MLKEIAQLFLRLGLLGFGGPVATMAMMEEETCRKRGWIAPARFSEIYALCKILPGPVATQMAIYLGSLRAGRWGGALAGFCFILPSFLLVLACSYAYSTWGVLQKAPGLFTGMQTGALVTILLSLIQLSRPYRRDLRALGIALVSAIIVFYRPGWEPLVILAFGLWGASRALLPRSRANSFIGGGLLLAIPEQGWDLFWSCFKAGAFTFGTGLAIVPVLEHDSVTRFGWLTHAQFMDGLALGQVTPGPVVITATFIGFKAAGLAGALSATIGIFLPAFINILLIVPWLWKRVSRHPATSRFSQTAIPAVIGGILATLLRLSEGTLRGPSAWLVLAAAVGIAWRLKAPAWIVIPACGALGLLLL